jgi:hypothetical protein
MVEKYAFVAAKCRFLVLPAIQVFAFRHRKVIDRRKLRRNDGLTLLRRIDRSPNDGWGFGYERLRTGYVPALKGTSGYERPRWDSIW